MNVLLCGVVVVFLAAVVLAGGLGGALGRTMCDGCIGGRGGAGVGQRHGPTLTEGTPEKEGELQGGDDVCFDEGDLFDSENFDEIGHFGDTPR